MSGHGGAAHGRAAAVGAKEVLRKPLQGRDLAESLGTSADRSLKEVADMPETIQAAHPGP